MIQIVGATYGQNRGRYGPFPFEGTVYCVLDQGGQPSVFRSTDMGDTWTGHALGIAGGVRDSMQDGSLLHILYLASNGTLSVVNYNMSTNTWATPIASSMTPRASTGGQPGWISKTPGGQIVVCFGPEVSIMGNPFTRTAIGVYSGSWGVTNVPADAAHIPGGISRVWNDGKVAFGFYGDWSGDVVGSQTRQMFFDINSNSFSMGQTGWDEILSGNSGAIGFGNNSDTYLRLSSSVVSGSRSVWMGNLEAGVERFESFTSRSATGADIAVTFKSPDGRIFIIAPDGGSRVWSARWGGTWALASRQGMMFHMFRTSLGIPIPQPSIGLRMYAFDGDIRANDIQSASPELPLCSATSSYGLNNTSPNDPQAALIEMLNTSTGGMFAYCSGTVRATNAWTSMNNLFNGSTTSYARANAGWIRGTSSTTGANAHPDCFGVRWRQSHSGTSGSNTSNPMACARPMRSTRRIFAAADNNIEGISANPIDSLFFGTITQEGTAVQFRLHPYDPLDVPSGLAVSHFPPEVN